MTNMKLIFGFTLVSAILLVSVPYGTADCCGTRYNYAKTSPRILRCEDCTQPKAYYCAAGDEGCNIFGCNCDEGCRQPIEGRKCSRECCDEENDRKRRDVGDFMPVPFTGNYTGNDVMNNVDTNKDGRLDEMEVKIFATRYGLPVDAWRHLDTDGDGHLSAHEIDSDLVPLAIVME